jgi:5'-nucleotidase
MRYYYEADCCMMAAGTIRGDQIYPPGILRMKDILNW